jgi:NADP-dependent 3-hydroxy acid dehydrogenase YdfG
MLVHLDSEEIDSVINTNIRGTILGSRVALSGMMKQGFGALYNMEGLGSDGRISELFSPCWKHKSGHGNH